MPFAAGLYCTILYYHTILYTIYYILPYTLYSILYTLYSTILYPSSVGAGKSQGLPPLYDPNSPDYLLSLLETPPAGYCYLIALTSIIATDTICYHL